MKYYIKSDEFERIVSTNTNALTAARNAILSLCRQETLDHYVYVDERGFRSEEAEHKFDLNLVLSDSRDA